MTDTRSDSSDEIDLNAYRKESEPIERWNLRKSFIYYHWDNFETEDEILCHAQLFSNIEFLGCRYSTEIMQKIKLLSDEVPQIRKYRLNKSNAPKTAAKKDNQNMFSSPFQKFPFEKHQEQPRRQPPRTFKVDINYRPNKNNDDDWNENDKIQWEMHIINDTIQNNPSFMLTDAQKTKNMKSLLRNVVIFESGDENLNYCLNKTIASMKKIGKFEINFDAEIFKYFYIFNGQTIAEGRCDTKESAKEIANEKLLKVLRQHCYTIRNKLSISSNNQVQQERHNNKIISRLGYKKDTPKWIGNIDLINMEIKIERKGLDSDFDEKCFKSLLENYKENHVEYDLLFSPNFSKEERGFIS